jgi:hypothetical protein
MTLRCNIGLGRYISKWGSLYFKGIDKTHQILSCLAKQSFVLLRIEDESALLNLRL